MVAEFYDDSYYDSTGDGVPKTDRGTYRTLLELQTAIPAGTTGDYAKVDTVDGNAKFYLWDVDLQQWVESGYDGSQSQPLSTQLSEISDIGDAPADSLLQRKSVMGIVRWVSRTIAEFKTDLQLNNVPNVDATQRSNHSGTQAISTIVSLQSIIDSFTSAIAGKEPTITTGTATQYWTGLKTFADLTWSVIQNIPNTVSQLGGLTPANDDFIQQKGGVLTNRTIDQVKVDLDIDEVLCKAYLIENTVSVPGYNSSFNELWFLQNNLAQHTIRLIQWAGFGATWSYSFGWPTLSSTGNQTGVTQSIGTEWNQLPRIAIQPAALTTICGFYFTQSTHYYPLAESNHGHMVSTCFGIHDGGGSTLIANARMFVGDTTSSSAPSDVDPRTLANAIGVIQSPTAPLPNRLYFYVNGNAVNGVLYDTGMDVSISTGWRFTIFNIRNTRTLLLRITDINTDASFNQVIDLLALPATNQPTSSAYSPRAWRSTGGALGTALRLAMNKIYLENKN